MSKYVIISALLFIIPISALAGNTVVVRASFTIPQRVEIKKEQEVSKELEYEIIVEEEKVIATEEVARGGQKVLLKTVLVK